MAVKAKFKVNSITHTNPGGGWAGPAPIGSVKLIVAYDNKDDNKEWAAATPSGTIDMVIGNPDALEFFNKNLGKTVDITFGEVE